MSARLAALALLLSIPSARPLSAELAEVVFEDRDFATWTTLAPVGDPSLVLERVGAGDPYARARHRHVGGGYSRKQSLVGPPDAVYGPAAQGEIVALDFSARFRPRFQGLPPIAYASRVIQAYPLVRQAGRSYLAARPLYQWTTTLPQELWTPHATGDLVESDFLLDGVGPGHPDFSFEGPAIGFGLAITTSFQTGLVEPNTHLFELDFDDFVVRRTATSALPRLVFPGRERITTSRGLASIGSFQYEGEHGAGMGPIFVRLSRTSPSPVRFGLRNDSAEYRIEPGQLHSTLSFIYGGRPAARAFEFVDPVNAELGEPHIFVALVSRADYDCSFSTSHHWLNDLYDQGYDWIGSLAKGRATAGAASDPLETLRALRDEVMSTSVAGRRYVELYRTHSPAIVRALASHPALLLDLWTAQGAWLEAFRALVDGDGAGVEVTPAMADDLAGLLDGFAAAGEPALARAVTEERERLGLANIAGLSIGELWERVVERGDPPGCVASATRLCLGGGGGGGGRFAVEADFVTFDGVPGRGQTVKLSDESGYLWFFDPANVELLVKVLEGCGTNDRIWSYNAGLSNLAVELFVHDPSTGRGKVYGNGSGEGFAPILDSDFLPCDGGAAESVSTPRTAAAPEAPALGGCAPSEEALCLLAERFRVSATYRTAAGVTGAAHAVPLTSDTGTFWFFSPGNVELVVKAIDACGHADFESFWIFAAGTTDVEVELTVDDTLGGGQKVYRRPLGAPFAPILDSAAFDACP